MATSSLSEAAVPVSRARPAVLEDSAPDDGRSNQVRVLDSDVPVQRTDLQAGRAAEST